MNNSVLCPPIRGNHISLDWRGVRLRFKWVTSAKAWLATTLMSGTDGMPRVGMTLAEAENELAMMQRAYVRQCPPGYRFAVMPLDLWQAVAPAAPAPDAVFAEQGTLRRVPSEPSEFVDLHGNVWQWTGGGDPPRAWRLVGGSYLTPRAEGALRDWIASLPEDMAAPSAGFRAALVRIEGAPP